MRLLLDTHVWLWSLLAPERLTLAAREALEHEENELYLSPISVWELILLVEKGRIELDSPVDAWVADVLAGAPLFEAPLTLEATLASRRLSLEHRDPADRLLAATALAGSFTLVTVDERLLACPEIQTLSGR